MDELLDHLRAVVGPSGVLTEADVVAGYVTDWTGRFQGTTPAVVRPGTVDEVAAVVGACDRAGVAVVLQGGNTGLVGGAVPLGGEVVLSLRRLDTVGPVDHVGAQVTAGAGLTLAALQAHLGGSDLAFGVDLAARESATIGGMVATNAGGLNVLRHGHMRAQVVGIEAVLADGRVVRHLGGLAKDNTGYDLAGLLCGSEGTLAVVTAARLRLVPALAHHVTALLALRSTEAAVAATAILRSSLPTANAIELFFDDGLALVCRHLGTEPPFPAASPAYLLVEAAAAADPTDELAAAVARVTDVDDVAVADSTARSAALWRYREAHTEAVNHLGTPVKLDITVPAGALAGFVSEVRAAVAAVAPGARTFLFGHAADGNIHVNVVGAPDDDAVELAVLELVAGVGGSISAEHGIGAAKRPYLHLNRSAVELDVFRAVKAALDPKGTLNPGVLLP